MVTRSAKRIESLMNSSNIELAGEVMRLALSGKVRSPKLLESKARLALAVESGDVEAIEKLLGNGASPNDPAFDDCLLTRAIWRNQMKSLRMLLRFGADPNQCNKGCEPLLQAVSQHNLEATQLLVEGGAKVNLRCPSDQPALLNACLGRQDKIVAFLLTHGASTELYGTVFIANKLRIQKVTPLMAAVWVGDHEIVRQLLAAGGKMSAKDSEGKTPLDWLKRCKDQRAVSAISAAFAKANSSATTRKKTSQKKSP